MIVPSGGINVWGEFPGSSRSSIIEGLAYHLAQAGWFLDERVPASVRSAIGANPGGGTFRAGSFIYSWVHTLNNSVRRQVLIGANAAQSTAHLVAAINEGAGKGSVYSTPTHRNPYITASTAGPTPDLVLTFRITGTAGNATPSSIGRLIGGGYVMRAASPQQRPSSSVPLQVRARIVDNLKRDPFSNPLATIRFEGVVFPDNISDEKDIRAQAGFTYRVVANRCQFFLYLAGDVSTDYTVVCGGIPWVPQRDCGDAVVVAETDEAWWITSKQGGRLTFRASLQAGGVKQLSLPDALSTFVSVGSDWKGGDGAFDENLMKGAAGDPFGDASGLVRLLPLMPIDRWDLITADPKRILTLYWGSEQPMFTEPLIEWADTDASGQAKIRGQLYDAWIHTKQWDGEQVIRIKADIGLGLWLTFTHQHKFGTLLLKVPSVTPAPFALQTSWAF